MVDQKRQCIYELLGAPSLLHRHDAGYSSLDFLLRQPPSHNVTEWQQAEQNLARAKSRWYYPVDHPWRPRILSKESIRSLKRKASQLFASMINDAETSEDDDGPVDDFDTELQESRSYLLRDDVDADFMLRSYARFDQSYVDAQANQSHGQLQARIPQHRLEMSQHYAIERSNAAPEYLAPFDPASIEFCLEKDEGPQVFQSMERTTTFPHRADDCEGPLQHGNGLVCVPCPCCNRRWCLIHPTGDLLSVVCVSQIRGPMDAAPAISSIYIRKDDGFNQVDVGERILQIAPCGEWSASSPGYFVVRTASYTTLISIGTGSTGRDDEDMCSYFINEVARVDLRSFSRSHRSFRPIDVACHPRYGDRFTNPLFAIACHSDRVEQNVVHHVSGRQSPTVKSHVIGNLRSISHLDFASPMTLWSAASSYVRPALQNDLNQRSPMVGNGTALYSIDLRTNLATFQWSPSAEQFVPEGNHSLSGIMTDWSSTHRVVVSSMSAGKMWEIDARMSVKAINTWSLHALCNEEGARQEPHGFHGFGTLLVRPSSLEAKTSGGALSPLISVEKSPNTFSVNVFQRPLIRPAFLTSSLECTGPGLEAHFGSTPVSVGRTASFALPEVNEKVFTCGLAAFRTKASKFLTDQQLEGFGYSTIPENVLCLVTMTNRGDLYSHSLLECSANEESRSQPLRGMPVGTNCLRVQDQNEKTTKQQQQQPVLTLAKGYVFCVNLTDQPPVTSDAIIPFTTHTRGHCPPFKAYDYNEVLQQGRNPPPPESTKGVKLQKLHHTPQLSMPRKVDSNDKSEGSAVVVQVSSQQMTKSVESLKDLADSVPYEKPPEIQGALGKSDITDNILSAIDDAW